MKYIDLGFTCLEFRSGPDPILNVCFLQSLLQKKKKHLNYVTKN